MKSRVYSWQRLWFSAGTAGDETRWFRCGIYWKWSNPITKRNGIAVTIKVPWQCPEKMNKQDSFGKPLLRCFTIGFIYGASTIQSRA